ncbi:MAG: SpoIVB peptidase S55 domain-containing protein [Sandaracinaceae bacterium]
MVSAVALGQVRGTRAGVIPVSEITPGMTGYGLTVFRGTQPERFDVEVIDVLHNFRPDQDLILIRTPHPLLDRAHVVAGMSGSPIYLDGRLAGAYAYGWPFGSDAVAGVTPIAPMLTELRRPLRPDPFAGTGPLAAAPRPRRGGRVVGPHLAGLPPYRGGDVNATTALAAHIERLGGARAPDGATLRPAATPLLLGGFDDSIVRMLDAQLAPLGLVTLQAGGAGQVQPPPNAPTRYVDGGAVGIQIVRGDVASTAVGTVTHVEGDRVVAFGHPMVEAGQTSLPAALVRVLHILVSINRSFKISEPIRPLGTLVNDRQSGIVVDSTQTAITVPVRVRVRGVEGAPRTEWNFEVASHRVLTPVIMNAAILNAIKATVADNTDVMYEVSSRVFVEGRTQPEVVVDSGYSRSGAANPLALSQLRLFRLIEAIYGNSFEVTRAARVEVDLDLRFGRETVEILDASVPSREVDPGATVPVRVVLRRYEQDEEVRVVPVRIPERLAGQTVRIDLEPGPGVDIEHVEPRSLDELFETVHERYPTTSMVMSLSTPSRGLRFPGHVVRHLPSSALDSLQLTNDADRARPFITYDRHEVGLDRVVSGGARIELTVRRTPR